MKTNDRTMFVEEDSLSYSQLMITIDRINGETKTKMTSRLTLKESHLKAKSDLLDPTTFVKGLKINAASVTVGADFANYGQMREWPNPRLRRYFDKNRKALSQQRIIATITHKFPTWCYEQ